MKMISFNVRNSWRKNPKSPKGKQTDATQLRNRHPQSSSVASRKLGTLLTKVASNKHFQRFAALKPVADVMEKLSNSELGVNIELLNISGLMTVSEGETPRVFFAAHRIPF